jgi:FtsP/CotA-like multicopper oxidase with cupredoxin domain
MPLRAIRKTNERIKRSRGPLFSIAQRCRENAMKDFAKSRRGFLKTTGAMAGGFLLWPRGILAQTEEQIRHSEPAVSPSESAAADYTLHIEASPVEIAPKRIISITTYNGQFPGPLLRFKEGQQVTVDVFNDTDTPEQLHWHAQKISTDVTVS